MDVQGMQRRYAYKYREGTRQIVLVLVFFYRWFLWKGLILFQFFLRWSVRLFLKNIGCCVMSVGCIAIAPCSLLLWRAIILMDDHKVLKSLGIWLISIGIGLRHRNCLPYMCSEIAMEVQMPSNSRKTWRPFTSLLFGLCFCCKLFEFNWDSWEFDCNILIWLFCERCVGMTIRSEVFSILNKRNVRDNRLSIDFNSMVTIARHLDVDSLFP